MSLYNSKNSNILLLSILSIRLILLIFNIHYYYGPFEFIFWLIILTFLILNWTISEENEIRKIISQIRSFIILSFLLANITYAFTNKFEKPDYYKGFPFPVWSDFEQSGWGGNPHCYKIYGESYLGDLFCRKKVIFEIDCDGIEKEIYKFEIPSNINLDNCFFYEKKALLFENKKMKCFKLKKI